MPAIIVWFDDGYYKASYDSLTSFKFTEYGLDVRFNNYAHVWQSNKQRLEDSTLPESVHLCEKRLPADIREIYLENIWRPAKMFWVEDKFLVQYDFKEIHPETWCLDSQKNCITMFTTNSFTIFGCFPYV